MADDKRLERIENKVDKIGEHIGEINVTLGEQHISLVEHIRRTAIIEKELLPIKKHVNMIQGVMAFITLLATIVGIIMAFKK